MYNRYIERIKQFFTKKLDYATMYESKCKECDGWEFKFNKLQRQLTAILKESDS